MHDETGTRSRRPSSLPSQTAVTPGKSGNATDSRTASVPAGRYQDDSPPDAGSAGPPEDARTSRERPGWQIRTTRVLADLLALALRDGLPRIAWTVGDVGANLAGRCYGRTGTDRRRQFEAWCAAVGATPKKEFTGFGGVTYLRAVAARYDGLVDVIVLADIFPDEAEAGDA